MSKPYGLMSLCAVMDGLMLPFLLDWSLSSVRRVLNSQYMHESLTHESLNATLRAEKSQPEMENTFQTSLCLCDSF